MPDSAEEQVSQKEGILSWVITIAIAVGLAVFIHAFVAEPFVVPTGSMLNTIQLDDRVLGEKVSYRFRDPKPGEIVMFDNPDGSNTILVKRVIATAGQTVDLSDGKVLVDGVALDEPYVEGQESYPIDHSLKEGDPLSYPFVVPEGCIWVMGDNRSVSLDSRYFGAVPRSSVVARAVCTFWPLSDLRWL